MRCLDFEQYWCIEEGTKINSGVGFQGPPHLLRAAPPKKATRQQFP